MILDLIRSIFFSCITSFDFNLLRFFDMSEISLRSSS